MTAVFSGSQIWSFFSLLAMDSGPAEHAVSLKQVVQHMEACPDLTHYGLCGMRKWSSRGCAGLGLLM